MIPQPSAPAGTPTGMTPRPTPQRPARPVRPRPAAIAAAGQPPATGFNAMSQPQPSPGWGDFSAKDSVVDDNGFPRVNLGSIYNTAKRGLTEETYNNAADAGFGALRAGPYVASLNQNIGNLQGQIAGKAADLSEAEAGRRLSDLMQSRGIASQEKMQGAELGSRERMQGAELGSRATLQEAQLAAQKANLGMELTSREKLALASLGEEGRQFDAGMGQRASEFGSNLAFQTQQHEDQQFQQWLNYIFGGANAYVQPTGRSVPGGSTIGGGGGEGAGLIGSGLTAAAIYF